MSESVFVYDTSYNGLLHLDDVEHPDSGELLLAILADEGDGPNCVGLMLDVNGVVKLRRALQRWERRRTARLDKQGSER